MQKNQMLTIGGVLLIGVIGGLGYLLGVQPQLDAANASDDQLSAIEAQNTIHSADLAVLKEDFAKIAKFERELATLREAIPAGDDLDAFLGQLHSLEAKNGAVITAVSPLDAQPFIPTAEIAPMVPASVDATTFVAIPVKISLAGTKAQVLAFIDGLQSGDRLCLVSGVVMQQDIETPTLYSADVSTLVYVLLDEPIVAVAPTAVAPPEGDVTAEG